VSHGCFNRPPLLDFNTLPARWPGDEPLHIPNRMKRECQYALDDKYADKGCVGCKHQKKPTGEPRHEAV